MIFLWYRVLEIWRSFRIVLLWVTAVKSLSHCCFNSFNNWASGFLLPEGQLLKLLKQTSITSSECVNDSILRKLLNIQELWRLNLTESSYPIRRYLMFDSQKSSLLALKFQTSIGSIIRKYTYICLAKFGYSLRFLYLGWKRLHSRMLDSKN